VKSDSSMKVLIANKFFFRNGGSEVVMFQERDFLLKNGIGVVDFSMRDERNFSSPYAEYFVGNRSYGNSGGGLTQHVAAAVNLVHSAEAVRKIGELIDREKPDIVHCHNIYHQLTPSIIGAAKRKGVPVVLTLHDYKPVCPVYTRLRAGQVCSDCLDGKFVNVLKHRCADGSLGKSALLYMEAVVQRQMKNYEKVDLVLAPSQFMAESVISHRFPAERVRLLYNGIDISDISPSSDAGNYILYFGRLSQEKGIRTLCEAHSVMDSSIQLVVAGTGPLEGELRERYPRVQFLGYVSGNPLRQAVSGAAVVVVPSEWFENCPMSVLEAMAYGKAVVASRIGGIPELVVHDETGLLFVPGDVGQLRAHLEMLMHDGSLRKKLGKSGRNRVESHFLLSQHNDNLLQIYSSMLK
jgi:glycosyltransferase involved in cell wall biosynthesis